MLILWSGFMSLTGHSYIEPVLIVTHGQSRWIVANTFHTRGLGGLGLLGKKFDGGCAAPVFDRIPLAKEILVENIPLAKENFLIMSPLLRDFKAFQPKYSLVKGNFLKKDNKLVQIGQF